MRSGRAEGSSGRKENGSRPGRQDLAELTAPAPAGENPVNVDAQILPVVDGDSVEPGMDLPADPARNAATDPGLTEKMDTHEQ